MKPTRVVLADDHRLIRAGIRLLLEQVDGVAVVGEAENGRQALDAVRVLRPDVILLDIAMGGLNGIDAAARLAAEYPDVRVIILSMHANEEYVWRALRAGAKGYLLKDAEPAELEIALAAVMRGETYLTPAVSKPVVDSYLQRVAGELRPAERLTARQREVLQLIAEGRSNKEIAEILVLSVKTVETHRSQLMNQLDIHDVTGLVRYAIRNNIISLD